MGYFSKWILQWVIVVLAVLLLSFILLYALKPTTTTTTTTVDVETKQLPKTNQLKTFFKKKINSKMGYELFDAVIYTNLDSRPDRRYQIEKELARIGFQPSKIIRNPGILSTFPALGCSLAILKALELFELNTRWKNCLLMEDDLIFNGSSININEQLSKFELMHLDWDILMLGSNTLKFESTNIDFLVRILDAQTTAGFAVNRKFLPKLIQNVKEGIEKLKLGMNPEYCIDTYWKSLQKNNNWYTFHPPLAYQRDGYSDIEKKLTSYNDKTVLIFKQKKIEYLICIKTCLPRLNSNPEQLKTLKLLSEKYPIDYITYYGSENQKEEYLYEQQHKILTVKTKDDYLNLSDKIMHLFKFLFDFIRCNETMKNLKGIVLTDEDIQLFQDHFYNILEDNKHLSYWGNIAHYTKELNLSDHIIQKCKQSKSLQQLVKSKYPLLETVPIAVSKCSFTSGGFTFLSTETLLELAQLDSFFAPFPSSNDLKYHLGPNNEYFKDLAVFDDTQIGIALQSIGIFPKGQDISKIAHWD